MRGKRVLIVDDVITAGTAIREAKAMLDAAGASTCGVAIALDRQEVCDENSSTRESAIERVERDFGVPVIRIIRLDHIFRYAKAQGAALEGTIEDIRAYRERYSV